MRIFFLFRVMMAEPVPKIGMNELLPIQTCHPEHGQYDINLVDGASVCNQKACTRSMGLRESLDGVG